LVDIREPECLLLGIFAVDDVTLLRVQTRDSDGVRAVFIAIRQVLIVRFRKDDGSLVCTLLHRGDVDATIHEQIGEEPKHALLMFAVRHFHELALGDVVATRGGLELKRRGNIAYLVGDAAHVVKRLGCLGCDVHLIHQFLHCFCCQYSVLAIRVILRGVTF